MSGLATVALAALSLSCVLSFSPTPLFRARLTHLRVRRLNWPLSPDNVFPSVTHLSLAIPGKSDSSLAPAFPSLTHLTLEGTGNLYSHLDSDRVPILLSGCTGLAYLATAETAAMLSTALRKGVPAVTLALANPGF